MLVRETGSLMQGRRTANNSLRNFAYSIRPYAMWMKGNRGIGLQLGFLQDRSRQSALGLETIRLSRNYSATLFWRFFLSKKSTTFKFWLSPRTTLEYQRALTSENGVTSQRANVYLAGIGLAPGVSCQLSEKINLVGSFSAINYWYTLRNRDDFDTLFYSHSFGIDFSPRNWLLGIEFRW